MVGTEIVSLWVAKKNMLQPCILEFHGILIDEKLTGLRDVVPYAQGVEALAWASLFPIDHALNDLCHLVLF